MSELLLERDRKGELPCRVGTGGECTVGGAAAVERSIATVEDEARIAAVRPRADADQAKDRAVVAEKRAEDSGQRKASGNVRADLNFLDPKHRWANGLEWYVVAWLGLIHLGALAAPWFFSWQGLAAFLALTWLTGPLGVCLGYHRLLTHNSFQTFRWVRRALATLGVLAGEGPPITWVSVHRQHHQHSDRPGDPHSPRDGAWWSHMVWLFPRPRQPQFQAMIERYGKDLLADPYMRFLDRTFLLWHLGLAAALGGLGWLLWGLAVAASMIVWGSLLRMVYVLHVTWLVNSASHMWGYRNFETKDDSRNLWWVGLLAFGEGWHNNHHAHPGRARHGGYRWWEIDLTYRTIWLMEILGLAWGVVRPRARAAGADGPRVQPDDARQPETMEPLAVAPGDRVS